MTSQQQQNTSLRRMGASCLLRPKDGPECAGFNATVTLSVTLIHQEQLPSYAPDKFYLMNEVEHHAHSTIFLSEYLPLNKRHDLDYHDDDNDTQETASVNSQGEDHATGRMDASPPAMLLPPDDTLPTKDPPPFIILYMRWGLGSAVDLDPRNFTECVILEAVNQARSLLGVMLHPALTEGTITPTSISRSIYLVIDRLAIPDLNDTALDDDAHDLKEGYDAFRQEQEDLVERLAKSVATHPQLRSLCQGITVGLSSHPGAVPGLEACVNALQIGLEDRRLFQPTGDSSPSWQQQQQPMSWFTAEHESTPQAKSCLGFVTNNAEHLTGIPTSGTKAGGGGGLLGMKGNNRLPPLHQSRVSAEWNGQGNLISFAQRAHYEWGRQRGLALSNHELWGVRPPLRLTARQQQNRLSNNEIRGEQLDYESDEVEALIQGQPIDYESDEELMDQALLEYFCDGLGTVLLLLYACFHYRNDVLAVSWVLDLDALVQWLRGL